MADELDFEIGSETEVAQAKSKFIVMPAGTKEVYLPVEMQMPDWDTPNVSIKFPVVILSEGENKDKEDKLSTGVGTKGWKLIETLDRLKIDRKKNPNGQISFNRAKVAGMKAVGHWVIVKGKNQTTGVEFDMPKLQEIMPADFKLPDNQKIM
jgi:hypothetical protein